ncbi:unnamed protein product [Arctia plantaginis]|uniref:THAP-type domain-containing protein n=1 Tax=Arctia plantaginis TaxID=874455 RepID=A0A8S0ZPX7_ARCPL|nr:unnamed protein product [Arctia plantaginis]CAB3235136.1 unnamed protein product [Arctia plantaginis]
MSSNKYWKCYFLCETDGVLHRFPNPQHNEERFNLWMKVLDSEMQKRGVQYIYNNMRLCDQHFELWYRTPSRKLTRNAFPTLNIALYDMTQPVLILDLLVNMVPEEVLCSLEDKSVRIEIYWTWK